MSQGTYHDREFREHDSEFTSLQWPTQIAPLTPLEHLWDEVEKAMKSPLQRYSDPAQHVQRLVDFMPRQRLNKGLRKHATRTVQLIVVCIQN